MSILAHVPPGWSLRDAQRDLLLQIEACWNTHDVVVITAPTAVGKTLLGYVIARWATAQAKVRCNIMAPSNMLVEQIHGAFPDIRLLRRKDSYEQDADYFVAQAAARAAKIRLCNFHVAFANRMFGEVQIFDEAHTLTEFLQDDKPVNIWQREFQFPQGLATIADVIAWAQNELRLMDPDSRKANRLAKAVKDICAIASNAEVQYKRDMYRGRVSEVLSVVPGIERKPPEWLWPRHKVRKIVMMSATISREDIRELGLAGRRVEYLACPSPIPAANRPVIFEPWVNMARDYQQYAMPEFARRLRLHMATRPAKGLVHLPYSLASWLRELIPDEPRLLFHDQHDKQQMLDHFRSLPPESGAVLVASGMYEGVDLPFDAARWQVIGKVPFLSLADERVRKRADKYPDAYAWEAIKRIIQAAGRIVRDPTDYGETVLCDVSFKRLINEDKRRPEPLFPKFFLDAVQPR